MTVSATRVVPYLTSIFRAAWSGWVNPELAECDGAQAMLAAALHAEVAACIDAHAGEVDENGYRVEMPLT